MGLEILGDKFLEYKYHLQSVGDNLQKFRTENFHHYYRQTPQKELPQRLVHRHHKSVHLLKLGLIFFLRHVR